MVEAGTNNNLDSVINPALFYENLTPTQNIVRFLFATKPSASLGDRHALLMAGNVLGGGSSINLMLYVRAQRSDFDSWNTPGWSTQDLLPCLRKLETHHGKASQAVHGQDGPVQISQGGFHVARSQQDIIDACGRLGYPEFDELQDLDSCNGVERHLGNISPEGKRQDTAHAYLHPILDAGGHPHLHVLCQHRVTRVLFDSEKRACGVEVTDKPMSASSQSDSLTKTVRARKLVVLSGGTFGTPAILERSGIGSSEILKRAGISVVSELPGVGEEYQDHPLLWVPYRTNLEPHETGDALMMGRLSRSEALANKNPILGWNYCDVLTKLRPTEAEVAALGPDFKRLWDRDFRDHPDRPLSLSGFIAQLVIDREHAQEGQHMSAASYSAYPYGRGHVHITGSSIDDPLDVDSGYLTGEGAEFDLQTHVWAYKKHREIMRRTKLYRGELERTHPAYPDGSAAKSINLLGQEKPLVEQGEVQDLEYSTEDDAAIRQYVRERANTAGHSLGTAKMAPREEGGVVDKYLNVHGVQGLKIADLSIVPKNVGANTCNTAMVIGEKCAAIILGELGLKDGVLPPARP